MNSYELMGYCKSPSIQWRWISTFTYTNLFHAITNRFPPFTGSFPFFPAADAADADAAADYLLVSGAIDLVW